MSEHTKVFEYQVDGLSYTVTVYADGERFFADIAVTEGAMDVNAVYFGDDNPSGPSVQLDGPLNMNGGGSRLGSEAVQWDDAVELSTPGLGPDGADKDTFLSEGDTLTVELDIESLNEIDFFGIRATSTTTDEGSIKAVSGEPEEPEDPEDEVFDKVFFADDFDANGTPVAGFPILAEEPNPNESNQEGLPEGVEPTFENYLSYFETNGGDPTAVESVIFYTSDAEGVLQEDFRLDAPGERFTSFEEIRETYNNSIEPETMTSDTDESSSLIAAISLDADPNDDLIMEEEADEAYDFESV